MMISRNSQISPVQGLLLGLLFSAVTAKAEVVQFFGDFYMADARITNPLAEVKGLLKEATYNIVNFEGAATSAQVPHEFKRHLLRMPLSTADVLRDAGIHIATLANNHAMDFGFQGLFDSLWSLEQAQIIPVGAGKNSDEAEREHIIKLSNTSICLIAVSRTLPNSFWATTTTAGTSAPSDQGLLARVRNCATQKLVPIVVFHWGQELAKDSGESQIELAKTLINAGALAVVGHHPHVVQEISFHQGRPIIPSLGNFFFQSHAKRRTTGMAAQFQFHATGVTLQLIPLTVSNGSGFTKPHLLTRKEPDPIHAQKNAPCRQVDSQTKRRICSISYSLAPVAAAPSQSAKTLH